MSAGQFSERFEREARAVVALNHPHICTLHDVGPDYLVMEYVEGKPIAGPLPVEEALRYAMQIAEALLASHRKGIVHSDLKTDPIFQAGTPVPLFEMRGNWDARADDQRFLASLPSQTQARSRSR